jgi:hypothetical protein
MKTKLMWAVAAVFVACGGGGQMTADECTKDTDCKGSRVCEAGQCVDPSGSGGGSQSGSGGGSQSGSGGGSQSGSGGGTHSGSGGGSQSGSGGGTSSGPQSCFGGKDTDCPQGYWCNQQQCQATSLKRVGETCENNSDCAGGACLVRNTGDVAGYCSKRCESFSDCPTFWDCSEINNGAGTYCVQTN